MRDASYLGTFIESETGISNGELNPFHRGVLVQLTGSTYNGQIPTMLSKPRRKLGLGFCEQVCQRLRNRRGGAVNIGYGQRHREIAHDGRGRID